MRTRAFCACVLVAAACGGGGDPGPVKDVTPPVLITTVPVEGAATVRVTEPLQLAFDEPIAAGYTVRLYAGGQLQALSSDDVRLSNSGTTLTVRVPAGITLPASMALELSGVSDRAGNPMPDQPRTLHWTYPAWLPLGRPWEFGPADCAAQGPMMPTLYAAPGHAPYAAAASGVLCAREWTGSRWTTIPAPDNGSFTGSAFAADPAGGLAAGYRIGSGTFTLKRWADGTWSELPALPVAATLCQLSYRDGKLEAMTAYSSGSQYAFRAFRLVSGSWTAQGNALTLPAAAAVEAFGATSDRRVVWIGGSAYQLIDATSDWASIATGVSSSERGWLDASPLQVASDHSVMEWSADAWSPLGPDSLPATGSTRLHARPGVSPVVLSYTGSPPALTLRLWEWNGSRWSALGPSQPTQPSPSTLTSYPDGRVFLSNNQDAFQYNR